ncbi:hypothetical protein [Nesterenkonia alba]|uniref:hypothetical protein n=1 Tax=Nesterenkonia alba TaxID=515814 RepID=UPI0003B73E6C|nr:hypothetical protein [Nesterenkonia alba]
MAGKEKNKKKAGAADDGRRVTVLEQNKPEEFKTMAEVHKILGFKTQTSMRNAISKGRLDDLPAYRPEGSKQYFFKEHEVRAYAEQYYREVLEESRATIGELRRSHNEEAVERAIQRAARLKEEGAFDAEDAD